MSSAHDVIVIGSGAGGAPLALTLAQAGFDVLVLEKGPRHDPRRDYGHDEIAVGFRDFFLPRDVDEPHVLVRKASPKPRRTRLGWTANCVGGGTAHMGGFFYRFHPDDFRMRSRFGPCEALADWPYSYEELEPYYSRAEWEVGVAGAAGTNPFEGSRSSPYPLPPLLTHPLTELLDQVCTEHGLHPFPTPRSINSRPYQGRPACLYCRFCAGYGCPAGARGSTQAALLPRAEATGRCRVLPRAMVREITVDGRGRATGCIYFDAEGRERRVRGRVVCICCSAVESARLLLLSKSPIYPDGIGNGSGLVGRYLQFHAVSSGLAWFRYDHHPDKPLRDPHPFLERSVMDHYFLPSGVADLPKGGLLRFGIPQFGPIFSALSLAHEGGRLLWGERLKQRLRERHREGLAVNFEVFHDFLPTEETYMNLDSEVRDKWGLPVARIHLEPSEHHTRVGAWLVDRGMEILAAMGADEVSPAVIGDTVPFLVHGTCRAGMDPEASVLNAFCQSHEVPNLFVVDGSFMPTSGGAAPTLTILANSFRTADYIIARAAAGELS